MGKKRRSKRKGKSRKQSRSKAKRRRFISKIRRDGKISKKEGRKAAKKGISLRKIRNRQISDYRGSVRNFNNRSSRRKARNPADRRPTYEPLKIKRGAEQADRRRQERRISRSEPRRRRRREPSRPDPVLTTQPVGDFTPVDLPPIGPPAPEYEYEMPDVSYYEDELNNLRDELAEGMRMPEDPRNRQYVLGIRTKRGKRNRQGARGTFGRRSKRVQGLQSTSINL